MNIPEGYESAGAIAERLKLTDKKRVYEMANEFFVSKYKDARTYYHFKTMETIHGLKQRGIPKGGIVEIITLRNENKMFRNALVSISEQPASRETKATIDKAIEVLKKYDEKERILKW